MGLPEGVPRIAATHRDLALEVRDGRFHAGELELAAPGGLAPGPVTLGVRPHDLPSGDDARLVVERAEALGSETLVHGRLAGVPCTVARDDAFEVDSTPELGLSLAPEHVHWFGPDGLRRKLDSDTRA